jgi:hypothetical protein
VRQAGFVYLLGNRAMPTYYKIGMSTLDPRERACQLSRPSGVPEPFDVICHVETDDPLRDEQYLHEFLADFRHSFSREFFRFGWEHMPWLIGLFQHHPRGIKFVACDGWRRHKYIPDRPIENPWASPDEDGRPAMTTHAPDLVYVQEVMA